MKKSYTLPLQEIKSQHLTTFEDYVDAAYQLINGKILQLSPGVIFGLNVTNPSSNNLTIASGAIYTSNNVFGELEMASGVVITYPNAGTRTDLVIGTFNEILDQPAGSFFLVDVDNRIEQQIVTSQRKFGACQISVLQNTLSAGCPVGSVVLAEVTSNTTSITLVDNSKKSAVLVNGNFNGVVSTEKIVVTDEDSQIFIGTAPNQGSILGHTSGTAFSWGSWWDNGASSWRAFPGDTISTRISAKSDGSFDFSSNSGLTPGGTFTPTSICTISSSGAFTGKSHTPASTTSIAGLNVPHGTAPTSPVNGDIWTTTTNAFVRVNGVTYPVVGAANAILLTPGSLTKDNSGPLGFLTGSDGTITTTGGNVKITASGRVKTTTTPDNGEFCVRLNGVNQNIVPWSVLTAFQNTLGDSVMSFGYYTIAAGTYTFEIFASDGAGTATFDNLNILAEEIFA